MIAANLEEQSSEMFGGEVELDESYFGGHRKGKRGRSGAGKVVVFGLLKRGGRVYIKIIEDTKTKTLIPIIRNRIMPDSIVYTDYYRSYNALDVSEFHHLSVARRMVLDCWADGFRLPKASKKGVSEGL